MQQLSKIASLILLATSFSLISASAHAEVLNLNAAPLGTFTTLTLGDYQLVYVGFGDMEAVANVGGQNALVDSDPTNALGAEVTLSRVDGGVFTLNSADIAQSGSGLGFIRIDLGGSSYSRSSIPTTLTTVFPAGTAGVTAVDINIVDDESGFEVTNLNVTSAATPEPGSLALLGTGLLGVTGLVRKRFA